MPGLQAVGEISGGFFVFNYPRGSGLTKGAVFSKLAGNTIAARAKVLEKNTLAILELLSCYKTSFKPVGFTSYNN